MKLFLACLECTYDDAVRSDVLVDTNLVMNEFVFRFLRNTVPPHSLLQFQL